MFARAVSVVTLMVMTCGMTSCEMLQNKGFESGMTNWNCWGFECKLLDAADSKMGSHALVASNRTHGYQGPQQVITTEPGKTYKAQSWIKIMNDLPGVLGQKMELEVSYTFPDDSHDYINVAMRPLVTSGDGWFLLSGDFQAPMKAAKQTTFYYQAPAPGVSFAVDEASVTEVTDDPNWRNVTDDVIERLRKSDINVQVTTGAGIDTSKVRVQVVQTKKSFPFGCEVNSWKYVDSNQQKFRDFIHTHFNWAVQGNALKWRQFDWNQPSEALGTPLYARALNTINGLKAAGLKLRGHNMVWSVQNFIPDSVKAQSGDALRKTVKDHIDYVMDATWGKIENWDVNNENLHGQWFQEQLQDRDYDLELFRMMHAADPNPVLFLNDYNVAAQGAATSAYRAQGERFKNANVSMGGMGVQYHFHSEQDPNPTQIKAHLDDLATVGVPLWITEFDIHVKDQAKRADFYEKALRAVYGHPAVEGIMFWSWGGDTADSDNALAYGDNMDMTQAGRRVFNELLEDEWMTDESRDLATSGSSFSLRGFHGDYQVKVYVDGVEKSNLEKTFKLGKDAANVMINVH